MMLNKLKKIVGKGVNTEVSNQGGEVATNSAEVAVQNDEVMPTSSEAITQSSNLPPMDVENVQHTLEQNNYVFVHLPKTAGTSFRLALEKQYEVWADYGKSNAHTHHNVEKSIYEKEQPLLLKSELTKQNKTWLIGHFPLSKYSNFVCARNIISFVRNPIEQIISHYNHFVSHHNYNGSLDEFLARKSMQNFQSRNLNPLPISLIGFIGITERYDDSLTLINSTYNLNLAAMRANVNSTKSKSHLTLPEETTRKISALIKNDSKVYKEALDILERRKLLASQDKEWAYSYLTINKNRVLVGCAYYSQSSEPVELVLLRNGKEFKNVLAKNFYGEFMKSNFPRDRYVGIRFALGKILKVGDTLEVIVKSTQQNLTPTPLVMK